MPCVSLVCLLFGLLPAVACFFLGCSVSLLARALVASGPDCLCWSAVGNLIFLFGLVGVCSPMLFEFYFALHEGCSCFCS